MAVSTCLKLKKFFLHNPSLHSGTYAINSQVLESWHQRKFLLAAAAIELPPRQCHHCLTIGDHSGDWLTDLYLWFVHYWSSGSNYTWLFLTYTFHCTLQAFLYALPVCLVLWPTENAQLCCFSCTSMWHTHHIKMVAFK